jgi:hypothetical protein
MKETRDILLLVILRQTIKTEIHFEDLSVAAVTKIQQALLRSDLFSNKQL